MDLNSAERDLREAIDCLRDDNPLMAEHLLSNVLLKVRAVLQLKIRDQLDLERENYLKRISHDQDGRRIYEVLPSGRTLRDRKGELSGNHKRPKTKSDAPRKKRGWIEQMED